MTTSQIPFGKEGVTPREQRKFQYSAINKKVKPNSTIANLETSLQQASVIDTMAQQANVSFTDQDLLQNSHLQEAQMGSQQVNKLSSLHTKQVKEGRKLCKSCHHQADTQVPVPHKENAANKLLNSTASFAKATELKMSSKRASTCLQDQQMEDWMRGNYYAKLCSNMHITGDYDLAAGRTKKEFSLRGATQLESEMQAQLKSMNKDILEVDKVEVSEGEDEKSSENNKVSVYEEQIKQMAA